MLPVSSKFLVIFTLQALYLRVFKLMNQTMFIALLKPA